MAIHLNDTDCVRPALEFMCLQVNQGERALEVCGEIARECTQPFKDDLSLLNIHEATTWCAANDLARLVTPPAAGSRCRACNLPRIPHLRTIARKARSSLGPTAARR